MTIKPLIASLLLCVAFTTHAAPAAPPAPSATDDPFVGFLKQFKNCRARYAELDARVDAAGVRDASYYRVPGHPYFRTDRVLASFGNEVKDFEPLAGWIRRMREFDQEAREFEYLNLGMNKQERAQWRFEMLGCGKALASIELEDPAVFAKLLTAVIPPPEYVKPTPAQPASCAVAHQSALLQSFTGELGNPAPGSTMRLWRAKPVEDLAAAELGYTNAFVDELGFPGLVDSQWRALAEKYAPALWIETAGRTDQPGMPRWTGKLPDVDADQAAMQYQITFTRFGEARLVQINYFYWFGGRSNGKSAKERGSIDGSIWRVTLDNQAQPLVYESLHASGRDHLWFPAQPLKLRNSSASVLLPQTQIPEGPIALRLQAGSHALQRVVPVAEAKAIGKGEYTLQRYETLFNLPTKTGSSRNLYDPNGFIPGVQQTDTACLWSNRVSKPGALRVLGRIPTDYAGATHFDDARLLDEVFVPPTTLMLVPSNEPPV